MAQEQYEILQFFVADHLPGALREVSQPFCDLANRIATTLPRCAETSTALRKLLEAKDAAVRSRLYERLAKDEVEEAFDELAGDHRNPDYPEDGSPLE